MTRGRTGTPSAAATDCYTFLAIGATPRASHPSLPSPFLLQRHAPQLPSLFPPAIYTDPPSDAAHPAKMTVVHIPTHGLLINGLVYQPSGAGLHPTVVICHGLPGNGKNLDLAQALRRAGWNAATFNYRGSWGSPGNYRFAQNLEDSRAVLAYLRDPANAALLGIDTHRIVLAGHSMGGWVVAHTAASEKGLIGAPEWTLAPSELEREPGLPGPDRRHPEHPRDNGNVVSLR